MRLIIEPTEEYFRTDDGYPVRMWTGRTEHGTRVLAFISAICAPEGDDQSQLAAELTEIPGPQVSHVMMRQDEDEDDDP